MLDELEHFTINLEMRNERLAIMWRRRTAMEILLEPLPKTVAKVVSYFGEPSSLLIEIQRRFRLYRKLVYKE